MKDKTYSRSLRTTNKRVALAAARDFFHEITAKVYGSMVNVKAERELLYEDLLLALHDTASFTCISPLPLVAPCVL